MLTRRNLFAILAGLPFIGGLFSRAEATSPPRLEEFAATLKPFRLVSGPKIRLWKMGSMEHRILATNASMNKLKEKLEAWDHKSDLDIVWSDDISVESLEATPGDIDIVMGDEIEATISDRGGKKIISLRVKSVDAKWCL